jgi:hypothetical protein
MIKQLNINSITIGDTFHNSISKVQLMLQKSDRYIESFSVWEKTPILGQPVTRLGNEYLMDGEQGYTPYDFGELPVDNGNASFEVHYNHKTGDSHIYLVT